jgi:cytochrome b6-f complex iron-sulfur subunit
MTVSGPNPRRLFLRAGLASMGALALWLMNSLAKRTGVLPEGAESLLTVPLAAGKGILFYDRAIVISGGERLAVFSSTCPHLGCRINRAEGIEIVCPCHGSRFNVRGEVLRGPARRSLQPLRFELDQTGAKLRITLNNEHP